MSDYNDYTWIYDVNRTAATEGELPCYHAYKPPNSTSVCGRATTTHFGTKTPGAEDCEACLAITGPDPDSLEEEDDKDLLVFHSVTAEGEIEKIVLQAQKTDLARSSGLSEGFECELLVVAQLFDRKNFNRKV